MCLTGVNVTVSLFTYHSVSCLDFRTLTCVWCGWSPHHFRVSIGFCQFVCCSVCICCICTVCPSRSLQAKKLGEARRAHSSDSSLEQSTKSSLDLHDCAWTNQSEQKWPMLCFLASPSPASIQNIHISACIFFVYSSFFSLLAISQRLFSKLIKQSLV